MEIWLYACIYACVYTYGEYECVCVYVYMYVNNKVKAWYYLSNHVESYKRVYVNGSGVGVGEEKKRKLSFVEVHSVNAALTVQFTCTGHPNTIASPSDNRNTRVNVYWCHSRHPLLPVVLTFKKTVESNTRVISLLFLFHRVTTYG